MKSSRHVSRIKFRHVLANLYDHLFREKVYSFLHLDKPPIFVIIKLSGRNIAYFFIYSLF